MWVFRFFLFKQKAAYVVRMSDGSSDVCSSDLTVTPVPVASTGRSDGSPSVNLGFPRGARHTTSNGPMRWINWDDPPSNDQSVHFEVLHDERRHSFKEMLVLIRRPSRQGQAGEIRRVSRSEEHTSELQSLMRISYAVFCLKKKTIPKYQQTYQQPYQ